MNTTLSHQEQHVLQDNFDLFGETTNKDTSQQKSTKAPAPAPDKPNTLARRKQTPDNTLHQTKKAAKKNPQKRTRANTNKPEKTHTPKPTVRAPALDLHPNDKGVGYLAIRAASADTGIKQLKEIGVTIENYAMDKREITLKNVADALLDRGLKYRVNQQTLHWVLTESEIDTTALNQQDWIELSINKTWFDTQKLHIRRLKGGAYLDACAKIARQIPLKNQTKISPQST